MAKIKDFRFKLRACNKSLCPATLADFCSEVAQIRKKYPFDAPLGTNFNLFRILRLNHSEAGVCRVLTELLSPIGCHGQGDKFLRLFWQNVLRLPFNCDELKTAQVHREFVTGNSRRIDIVIETRDRFITIEVKIYAADIRH